MKQTLFADIILPLAVRGRFTYEVPERFAANLMPGMRVTVPFGNNRLYTGIVSSVHNIKPSFSKIREIKDLIDTSPSVNGFQLKLWSWISEYYMCSEGEVMKAALPSEINQNSFKAKQETCVKLTRNFSDAELNKILDSLKKAPRQQELLLTFLSLSGYATGKPGLIVRKGILLSQSNSAPNTLDILISKGILSAYSQPVSRIAKRETTNQPVKTLSEAQATAYNSIKEQLKEKDIVLLHGVTSSGKTEIYIHLIEEQLKNGRQVLYMLPEIALTTQIIERLRFHFGDQTGIYHSRLSDPERVEIWRKVAGDDPSGGYGLILGVRSSIFLPFNNLGLVIVDEEHDGSYKQHDPAPRYHARDSGIMLAALHNASYR
ncbi:MAG: DEAD/DEAH box helicase [Bacteroidia bacterium]|nr:DEAD/DEAH box helicase [Bacteroidia bacterium]